MSPYGDVIPIETITTNTTFNNSRFQKPCDSDLKYSKPCDGRTHIALCFATSFEKHIWSAWFCTYFDVMTKIFCAHIFTTTTTTTKAKLILNKLSEVHTYWRFNEHTYSDYIIKNIQLFDDNKHLMHVLTDQIRRLNDQMRRLNDHATIEWSSVLVVRSSR